MKVKCKSSLYIAETSRLFTEGKEYEIEGGLLGTHRDYFEPMEKMASAPENKMVTVEKETVKRMKNGRKKGG